MQQSKKRATLYKKAFGRGNVLRATGDVELWQVENDRFIIVKRKTMWQEYTENEHTEAQERFNNERAILKVISNHPNIVRVENVDDVDGITDVDKALVLEYCSGQSLENYFMFLKALKRLPLSEHAMLSITRDLLEGLRHMLSFRCLNSDIALTNLLVHIDPETADITVKYGDFDRAVIMDENALVAPYNGGGLQCRETPEMINGWRAMWFSDAFQVGMVLAEILEMCCGVSGLNIDQRKKLDGYSLVFVIAQSLKERNIERRLTPLDITGLLRFVNDLISKLGITNNHRWNAREEMIYRGRLCIDRRHIIMHSKAEAYELWKKDYESLLPKLNSKIQFGRYVNHQLLKSEEYGLLHQFSTNKGMADRQGKFWVGVLLSNASDLPPDVSSVLLKLKYHPFLIKAYGLQKPRKEENKENKVPPARVTIAPAPLSPTVRIASALVSRGGTQLQQLLEVEKKFRLNGRMPTPEDSLTKPE